MFVNKKRTDCVHIRIKKYTTGVFDMFIKRTFQTNDAKSLDEIFNHLLKCNIDIIVKNIYDANRVNTAASQERKDV